jgi:hypothetical protein
VSHGHGPHACSPTGNQPRERWKAYKHSQTNHALKKASLKGFVVRICPVLSPDVHKSTQQESSTVNSSLEALSLQCEATRLRALQQ